MSKIIRLTSAQLQRLFDDLESIPDCPIGPHLTDLEIASYITEVVSPEKGRSKEGIETHSHSCVECCEMLCGLFNFFHPLLVEMFQTQTEKKTEEVYQRILSNLAYQRN